MTTFQETTGYDLTEYVAMSLPSQVHITDQRRTQAIEAATERYIRLLKDGLPIGYHFDGQNIARENTDDLCPIGYPTKNGEIDLARVIDELNFRPVLEAYRRDLRR
jgi:hypothetical protein